jgi:hypothetical protein
VARGGVEPPTFRFSLPVGSIVVRSLVAPAMLRLLGRFNRVGTGAAARAARSHRHPGGGALVPVPVDASAGPTG